MALESEKSPPAIGGSKTTEKSRNMAEESKGIHVNSKSSRVPLVDLLRQCLKSPTDIQQFCSFVLYIVDIPQGHWLRTMYNFRKFDAHMVCVPNACMYIHSWYFSVCRYFPGSFLKKRKPHSSPARSLRKWRTTRPNMGGLRNSLTSSDA